MKQLSGSKLTRERRFLPQLRDRFVFPGPALAWPVVTLLLGVAFVHAQESASPTPTPTPEPTRAPEASTNSISREVKEIFEKSGKAVVKVRGTDQHGELSGTGFFIDPAGTLYTAFSVGGDSENLTVEFDGKVYPARVMLADLRSGIAILKADIATPALPLGKSEQMEVATPVMTIGFPLDLPETPSFGMVAGFDRKFLGRYFSTTHVRVILPPHPGQEAAPFLTSKVKAIGIPIPKSKIGSLG